MEYRHVHVQTETGKELLILIFTNKIRFLVSRNNAKNFSRHIFFYATYLLQARNQSCPGTGIFRLRSLNSFYKIDPSKKFPVKFYTNSTKILIGFTV